MSATKIDPTTSELRVGASNQRDFVADARPAHPNASGEIGSVTEVLKREAIYRRSLVVGDATAAVLAALLSAIVWQVAPRWPIIAVAPLAALIAKVQGLYDRDDTVIRKSTLLEWRSICQASALIAILEYISWTTLTSAYHGGGVRVFVFLGLASFLFTLVGRVGARRLARIRAPIETCLIVGGSADRTVLAQHIDGLDGVELAGIVGMAQLEDPSADLRVVVEELGVHRLVIVPDGLTPDALMLEIVRSAKAIGVRVSLYPTLLTAVGGCTVFDDLDGLTVLGVPRFGLSRSSRLLKRTFDLIGATFGLLLAAPALAVIAVAVKLDSPGPVFFRQTRVGKGGRHFKMLKFRSMVDGADAMKAQLTGRNEAADGLFKIIDDPRVTRVGALLRSSHLDELPQLVNVLLGEMSLVGPRPLIVNEDELISGGDRYRLHLTPGMTGPWQIRGPLSTPLSEMAKLDYLYISNWSLWQDVDILLKTAGRVIGRHGH